MKKWSSYIFILSLFFAYSILTNIHWFFSPDIGLPIIISQCPETDVELGNYADQMVIWERIMINVCSALAFLNVLFWGLIIFISGRTFDTEFKKINLVLDIWDYRLLVICLSMSLVDLYDWIDNANTRKQTWDWIIFGLLFIVFTIKKIWEIRAKKL